MFLFSCFLKIKIGSNHRWICVLLFLFIYACLLGSSRVSVGLDTWRLADNVCDHLQCCVLLYVLSSQVFCTVSKIVCKFFLLLSQGGTVTLTLHLFIWHFIIWLCLESLFVQQCTVQCVLYTACKLSIQNSQILWLKTNQYTIKHIAWKNMYPTMKCTWLPVQQTKTFYIIFSTFPMQKNKKKKTNLLHNTHKIQHACNEVQCQTWSFALCLLFYILFWKVKVELQ